MRAGHFARATLQLEGTRPVLQVPSSAVTERAGVYRVFVVSEGAAVTTVVRVIRIEGDVATLEADLPEGAVVVTAPPRNLADGVLVQTTGGN